MCLKSKFLINLYLKSTGIVDKLSSYYIVNFIETAVDIGNNTLLSIIVFDSLIMSFYSISYAFIEIGYWSFIKISLFTCRFIEFYIGNWTSVYVFGESSKSLISNI